MHSQTDSFVGNIYSIINATQSFLWSYLILIALIFFTIYFSIKTNFAIFRLFKEVFIATKKNILAKPEPNNRAITPFQAFIISMSARVGSGNLAGVAIALHLGGAGAIFWMWVISFFGAVIALIENTLAQAYKQKNIDYKNYFFGGPAYYILYGLKNPKLAKFVAIISILFCGIASLFIQINTVSTSWNYAFDIPIYVLALLLTSLTALMLFGGIQLISKWLTILFSVMFCLHIFIGIYFIVINFDGVLTVLENIFLSAFGLQQFSSGFVGVAIIQGFKRGLFSNDLGIGNMPCAAAMSNDKHPVNQALLQVFGTWLDSFVICTISAVVILLSGANFQQSSGVQLLHDALAIDFGEFGHIMVAVMTFLFVYTTLIANYVYSETNFLFLTKNENSLLSYRLLCLSCVCGGAMLSVDFVWDFADIVMGLLCICNLYAIYKLFPKAKFLIEDYVWQRKNGIATPTWNYDITALNKIK